MAIDNIIAAGIQPTTPIMSPMQSIGGLMQLRGQMADQALREAQMSEVRQRQQGEKLKADQANRDLTDQNTIQALSPEDHAKMYSGDLSVLHGKVQPTTMQSIQKAVDEHVNKLTANDKLNLENRASALGQLKETAVNLGAPMADGKEPDAGTINSRYQSARAGFAPLLKLAGIQSPLPASITTPEELRNIQVQLHAAESAVTTALNRKKLNADAEKAIADVEKAQADAEIAGKVNTGTSPLGVSEVQRMEQEGKTAEAAERKRRDDETYRHNLQTERAAFMNASREAKPKAVPASVIKGIAANTQMLSTIQQALDALDPKKGGDPDAVGFKGYIPDTMLNRIDEKGTTARGLLARVAAQEFHDFSGAAVTASEAARLKPFLPSVNDDIKTVRTKLESLKKQVEGLNSFQREAYAEGFQKLPEGKVESSGSIPTVASQADFDKLPSGAEFMEDGKKYRKP
jgi:hypothetical protein|tara:strand:- start:1460 stop:2839 length:1380 start_codon:yes stop_codon:yes gene_type:complete